MQSIKICENINLHHIPMSKFKTASVGIYIGRELKKEEASYNALLPYVLTKATKEAETAAEVAKYLQNLYGASMGVGVNKLGDNHFMSFEGEVIADRYAPDGEKLLGGLIRLMLSIVFSPVVEEGAFLSSVTERERINCQNRIKGIINDKTRYADMRCREEVFRGKSHGISEYGYIDELEKITPRGLYEYYLKVISESEINIFICGEADIGAVKSQIDSAVSGIHFKKARLVPPEIIEGAKEPREIQETTDLAQGKLSIGFRTGISRTDPEYWALLVANNIYGGGLGSKLFNNVREKLSLAYYVSTGIEKYKGFMLLHAGIAFQNLDAAKNEIFAQLDKMKAGEISDSELENAKSEIINGINSCYDDQQLMSSYYLGNIISGVDTTIEEYKEKIAHVTKDEVISAIQKTQPDVIYFLKN